MSTTLSRAAVVPVVGVSFTKHYPTNLHVLQLAANGAEVAGEPLPALLIRNPENPYDANAIEVHVPALGDMAMIGHLSREIAQRMAPRIDQGDRYQATVHWVRINPDHPDRPGIDLRVARVIEGES